MLSSNESYLDPPLARSSRSFELRHFIRRFWNQIFTWNRNFKKFKIYANLGHYASRNEWSIFVNFFDKGFSDDFSLILEGFSEIFNDLFQFLWIFLTFNLKELIFLSIFSSIFSWQVFKDFMMIFLWVAKDFPHLSASGRERRKDWCSQKKFVEIVLQPAHLIFLMSKKFKKN